jgi:hypothetical protein
MEHSEESKRIKRVVLSGHERQAAAFNYLVGALGAMTERGEPISCAKIAQFVELAVENSKSWHFEEGSE